jgi:hypothetical protein
VAADSVVAGVVDSVAAVAVDSVVAAEGADAAGKYHVIRAITAAALFGISRSCSAVCIFLLRSERTYSRVQDDRAVGI